MAKEQKSFFLEETKMPLMITDYDWDGADMHWHNYWEMLLQCEGETRISIGEEQFISHPGNVTVIEPNRLHETRSITDRHKILLIQFEKSVLMPFINSNGGNNYLSLMVDDGFIVRNKIEKSDETELGEAFMELRETAIGKKTGYEFELYSRLLHIIFLLLNKEYIKIPHIKDVTKKALFSIRDAMLYIDQNYQTRIRQYSGSVHFSPRQSYGKQNILEYGFSGQQQMLAYVMLRAARHLKSEEHRRRVLKTLEFFCKRCVSEAGIPYGLYDVDKEDYIFWWTGVLFPFQYSHDRKELERYLGKQVVSAVLPVAEELKKIKGNYTRTMVESMYYMWLCYKTERRWSDSRGMEADSNKFLRQICRNSE